jgi:hypothetical protein
MIKDIICADYFWVVKSSYENSFITAFGLKDFYRNSPGVNQRRKRIVYYNLEEVNSLRACIPGQLY